jgi:hypothetical protein
MTSPPTHTTTDPLLKEIDSRLHALFTRVAAGDDAPPGPLLRLEGLREAAVISGAAPSEALQLRMEEIYAAVAGHSMDAALGSDWRDLHPFPRIPLYMRRAPVVPGGGD